MGVIRRGILGGFSGSVGNVVGSSWKGIATMKAKPLSVANPNTSGQVEQRTKMTNVVEFAKAILATAIKPLNDRFASGMSGFNLFVQRNIALFNLEYPNPYSGLILSQGSITVVEGEDIVIDVSDNEAELTFSDNTGSGDSLATDVLYVVLHNQSRNTFATNSQWTRSQGGVARLMDMPAGTQVGDVVHGWMSFRRADGTKVSDSVAVLVTVNA